MSKRQHTGNGRRAPFNRGSATSEGASDFIEPHRETQAARIFKHLSVRASGGLTCAEIEAALGLLHQSASARYNDLANAGCIQPVGVQRGTPPSEVYIVVPGAKFDRFREWQNGSRPSTDSRAAASRGLLKAARDFVAAHGQGRPTLDAATATLHTAAWEAGGGVGKRPRV
jgi:hypothetical protein